MTIVEGQIETLKALKESLAVHGVTGFGSIGDIRRFLSDYETATQQLSKRMEIEFAAEIEHKQAALDARKISHISEQEKIREEIERQIGDIKLKIKNAQDQINKNFLYKAFYCIPIFILFRRASHLEKSINRTIRRMTNASRKEIRQLENRIDGILLNKDKIISERYKYSLATLTQTKAVLDQLDTLIAGVIGENAVVKALRELSDDHYLINDFVLNIDPPIYNRKENDRIFSIQIDHLLVCRSGVFLLETKNWSKSSIDNIDLRSPVKQILRTNFALFVLLNSKSQLIDEKLASHHWGSRKIPIRNIIVMVNKKPKKEFKHVKVLSLNELVGYIRYFDHSFDAREVREIFEYLKKKKMNSI